MWLFKHDIGGSAVVLVVVSGVVCCVVGGAVLLVVADVVVVESIGVVLSLIHISSPRDKRQSRMPSSA